MLHALLAEGLETQMKQQLKVILLNQYIGAIAIGYLIARAIEAFLGAFMPTFNTVLTQFLTGESTKSYAKVLQGTLISNLVLASLYFGIAYFLALWLYAKRPEISEDEPILDTP
jgi:hypothetical protein